MTNNEESKYKKYIRKGIIFAFWLLIWQGLALFVKNQILFVGPIETGAILFNQLQTIAFWESIWNTMLRIMSGFLGAFLMGVLFAVASYKWKRISELLSPFMTFLKTVPVASFVVLFLIWWKSEYLSTAVVFVVALPLWYISILEECRRLDRQYFEVARVYGTEPWKQLCYLIFPQMKKGILTTAEITIGMSFKSGVAAEIIGTPAKSIGQQMYFAKISLDTGYLFAYTTTIILVAFLCERIFCFLLKQLFCLRPCKEKHNSFSSGSMNEGDTMNSPRKGKLRTLEIHQGKKSFGEQIVFEHLDFLFTEEQWNYLTWESGKGKTTLLRLLAGLEKADQGEIIPGDIRCSMLFQENRLVEEESALVNVCLTAKSRTEAREHLLQVLDEADLMKKISSLSGGMKRRVALVRAVLAEGEVLLLDEPFTGLDEETKKRVENYIEKNRRGRMLIIASHER